MSSSRILWMLSSTVILIFTSCGPSQTKEPVGEQQTMQASSENAWQTLFDGVSLQGWRRYRGGQPGSSWVAGDGVLTLQVEDAGEGRTRAADGGDIITEGQYENFEFALEWRISRCGNSGIMFNVVEGEGYPNTYHTGPEMQILDDGCHPDASIHTHKAGDLYDLIACSEVVVRAPGEWNEVLIRVNNGEAVFHLNGTQVVSFTMFNDEWEERIANSKFKDMPGFGKYRKGHIALQDHDDEVSFRNIRIRNL